MTRRSPEPVASGRQPLLLSVWLPRVEAAPPWLGWRGARRLVGWVGPLAARPASPPGRWESSLYHPWSPQASSILTGSSCCLCLWRPLISVPPNGNEAAPSPPCPVSSPASHLPILSSPRGFRPRWAAGLPTPRSPQPTPQIPWSNPIAPRSLGSGQSSSWVGWEPHQNAEERVFLLPGEETVEKIPRDACKMRPV